MSRLIAVAGKGGVGKTTVAALLVRGLIARGRRPVLAVDADPNTCLDAALGVTVSTTLGGVREEAREFAGKGMSGGMDKQRYLEIKIAESLVEGDHFDLIAMGRSEGPGCYCYANNVLKEVLKKMASHYPWVVLDNEAGLENLSRRIVQQVDLLVVVADPSLRGLETAKRLHALALEMGIRYNLLALAVNRLRRLELPETAVTVRKAIQADVVVGLPDDAEIFSLAERGTSLMQLRSDHPVMTALNPLLDALPAAAHG
jgi:CO dehydrogenase maturation factor